MLSSITRIPLLVAAVLIAACDGSATPTAPPSPAVGVPTTALASAGGSERFVDENVYDLTGTLTGTVCDDGTESELVELQGQIYERFTVLFNPADGFHASYHTMPIGLRGIGTESGEEFRVKEQDHGSFNQTIMGAVGTYRQVVKLVGRTSGRSFSLVVRGHYTIDANGEIVVEREKIATDCE